MAKKAKEQKRPRASLLTKVVLLVLLGAIGWQLYGLQSKVAAAQAEKDQYAAQIFAEDNALFLEGKAAIQRYLNMSDEDIEAILSQCVAD